MNDPPSENGTPAPRSEPEYESIGSGDEEEKDINDQPGATGQQEIDRESWRRLLAESESGLRRFLSAKLPQLADVDDCFQAVTVAMLQNETPIPAAARKAWLFRVAANEAARWWRNKSTKDRVMEKHAQSIYQIHHEPTAHLENNEAVNRVHRAIGELPESARQIVRMRLNDSMTFQSIADQLDLPLGTVLTRMRRSLKLLRERLDDD